MGKKIDSVKKEVLKTINKAEEQNTVSAYFDMFIMGLIMINVVAIILETVPEYQQSYGSYFDQIELVSVIIFSVEYLIRLWTCTATEKYAHPIKGRISYIFSAGAIIDLLAIIPFYLPMLFPVNMMILRMLRLFRLLRILKLARYFTAFSLVVNTITRRREELVIILTLLLVMLILASSMMYYVENAAQPDVFKSIPATMWWAVATLTTVGYGDVYPITPLGKLLGAVIAIMGIGVFALPAGIIASGFQSELSKMKDKEDEPED